MAEPVVVTINNATILDEPDGGVKKTDTGGKSPAKSGRRWVKGSLFKRTLSDQDVSQRADRPPSGKSRARKESQDSLSGDSQTVGRVSSGGDIRAKTADSADEAEAEKSKFGDPKKLYKQNKELVKYNAQLTKLIDTLKHERDSLTIDKSRVKSDLKSAEKELKKVSASLNSARSEVERLRAKNSKHSSGNMEEGLGELQERVRQLEAELSERDEKLAKFRKKLSSQLNKMESGYVEENNDASIDKYDLTHQLHTEKETRAKLEGENSELRARVVNLESDLNQLLEMVDDQQREELVLSTSSKEISLRSTFSADALSSIGSKRSGHDSPSLHSSSPRNSPALQHRKQPSVDIINLQTCLQLALEEKKMAEQQKEHLQVELGDIRSEMEEVKRVWREEKDDLVQQLKKAHAENDAKQATLDQWKQQHRTEAQAAATASPRTQQTDTSSSPTKTRNRTGSSGSMSGGTKQPKSILKTKKPDKESSKEEVKQEADPSSPPTKTRTRAGSTGSMSGSTEQPKGVLKVRKPDRESSKEEEQKKERQSGRRGVVPKQQSRENFTAALAVFNTRGGGASLSKTEFTRERSASETSQGSRSARSSASPAPPLSPRKLSTENRSQSVSVVGKPPIHPQSASSSGAHSRQSSTDESSQKSPSRTAKRMSWNIAQRRKSFEELQDLSKPTPLHSRTASSPIMTRTLGSPTLERERESREKAKALEEKQRVEDEKATREKEKQQQELEAKEKRLEEKRRKEAEEKERVKKEMEEKRRKEAEEKDRLKKEREEREEKEREERKRAREEKRRKEAEEKERLKKEREEREREERKKLQREREEKRRKEVEDKEKEREKREEMEREERKRLQKEREEREREQRKELEEKKKRELELEKKRQLEEKKRQEQLELQRAKEKERKVKEEKEAALRRPKETDENKKLERDKWVQLEEEKRRAEKAAQAATDPQPNNKYQRPFGSIAMRRAAFEQNTNNSPTVLRRNGGKSPTQRPKSMDFAAVMYTQPTNSPSLSPTPNSSRTTSISIKTSKSPQGSPLLNQRKEIKEVPVGKSTTIHKPNPPVMATPRSATVSIVTTSSSPPLRRAQTISSSPTTLAVSTPDLTSVGMTNGTSSPVAERSGGGWSPGAQRRSTVSNVTKSPSSERKMAKSVSFSPNLSTANRTSGVSRPSAPHVPTSQPPSPMKFGAVQTRLGVSGAEDMKKAQSLQNIPEHAPADITPPAPTTHHTPVASHVHRRPRSERAKTTSLSRADTASLTNLISKLQVKEKGPVGNGVDHTWQTRSTPAARPASMYGSITPTRTDVIPRSLPSNKPKPHERKMERRATVGYGLDKSSKKSRLLRWCQLITEDYDNISVADFSRSFSNGLAFCAMLHHFVPDKIPYSTLNDKDRARNFKIAFDAAESEDIPSLLDIEDMVALPVPDWMSVMTYVSFIYQRFGNNTNGTTQQFLL